MYREQVMSREYRGFQGTWHIIAGAAGCQEYLDTFDEGAVYPSDRTTPRHKKLSKVE